MVNPFPDKPALRLPRNDREFRHLVKLLDALVDEVGESHPLASQMEATSVLIEKYEDAQIVELA